MLKVCVPLFTLQRVVGVPCNSPSSMWSDNHHAVTESIPIFKLLAKSSQYRQPTWIIMEPVYAEKQPLLPTATGPPAAEIRSTSSSRQSTTRFPFKILGLLILILTIRISTLCYNKEVTALEVAWEKCPQNPLYRCAKLTVPTNYFNASEGTTRIAMLKVPATAPASEQLGTIVRLCPLPCTRLLTADR